MPQWPALLRDRDARGYVAADALIRKKSLRLDALDELIALGFSTKEVQTLVINPRTLRHRRARREALSADEADRVFRLARTLAFAERVFGDREHAWRWLRRTSRSLGGRRPVDLLQTEIGARAVEEALIRLDEGMVV